MYTIAIINEKGGVLKTTTAAALLSGLIIRGKRVLAIDLDAQCNLSLTTGASAKGKTILDVLSEEIGIREAIQHTKHGDVIAGSRGLAGADAMFTETGKEYKLKEALFALVNDYDYVIIDTAPALSVLTINALTAANTIVIPSQADIFSLQGIQSLANTIAPVRKYCNKELEIAGILLTRYNPRSILSVEVAALISQQASKMGTKVFKSTIREAVIAKEAQIQQCSLFDYAPKAKVTADYKAFIEELIGD